VAGHDDTWPSAPLVFPLAVKHPVWPRPTRAVADPHSPVTCAADKTLKQRRSGSEL
jgi:hypothetical protein